MPQVTEFLPRGAVPEAGESVVLQVDELEAIRLLDLLGCTREECAEQMGVARSTVQQVYDAARRKLALALVEGRELVVAGGSYELCPHAAGCAGRDCARRDCPRGRCGCGTCHRSIQYKEDD